MALEPLGYLPHMRGYRRAWQVTWFLLAVAGTAVATVLWPGPIVVLTWLFGATMGAAAVTGCRTTEDDDEPFAHLEAREVLGCAVLGALTASAAAGWLAVSAAGGFGLVALAAVTSPWTLSWVVRRWGGRVGTSDPKADLGPGVDEGATLEAACRHMSTPQLCHAWEQTFTHVERRGDPRHQLRLLNLREAFLDELARRDPDGLDAWMCSTLPVSTAPTPFFGGRPPDVSS